MGQPGQPGQQPPPHWQQPPPGYYGYPPPGYGYGYGYPPQPMYGGAPPSGHLGWAIVAVIFFWPLAIPAFINYGKVDSLFYRGDIAGSMRASESVKKFGAIALSIGVALIVLWIILAVTVLSAVSSSCVGAGC